MDLFWVQVVGSCPVLKTKDQVGTSLPALCGHIVKLPIFIVPIGITGQTDFFLSEGNNECRVSCLVKGLRISD